MIPRIKHILVLVTACLWALFIFAEFWVYHPEMETAAGIFQYKGLALLLGVMGTGGSLALLAARKKKRSLVWFNGLVLFAFVLFLMLILIEAFFLKVFEESLRFPEMLTFLWSMIAGIVPVYLIIMLCFILGNWMYRIMALNLPGPERVLIDIAMGILVMTVLLFLLGAVGLLSPYILFPFAGIILMTGLGSAREFLNLTLFTPLDIGKDMRLHGLISVFLLLVLLAMNTITVLRPVPLGYDALTEYINLAALIQDYGGLVQGYRPYYWSLFISLGYLLFDSTAITLGISFAGSILGIFVFYRLCRKWLDVNFSMLCVLVFYATPMTNWLSYRDIKVDMGLLFFSLCTLLVFYHWASGQAGSVKKEGKKGKSRVRQKTGKAPKTTFLTTGFTRYENGMAKSQDWIFRVVQRWTPGVLKKNRVLVLLGLFTGFAMGIKLPAVLLFLAIWVGLWYIVAGRAAGFGASAIGLFVVLLAQLDTQAGLRDMHLSVAWVQWSAVLLGIGIFSYLARHRGTALRRGLRFSLVLTGCMAVIILPWMIKNVIESRSVSITALTNGKKAGPDPTIQELRRVWEAQKMGIGDE